MDEQLSNSKSNCLHSRKIMSLMDAASDGDVSHFMQDHVSNCSICFEEVENVRKLFLNVERSIPKVKIDETFKDSFRFELDEAFNNFLFPEGNKTRLKMKKDMSFLKSVFFDLARVFKTKRVAGLCALAIMASVALPYLLNH